MNTKTQSVHSNYNVEYPDEQTILFTVRRKDPNTIIQVLIWGLVVTSLVAFLEKDVVIIVLTTILCTAFPVLAFFYNIFRSTLGCQTLTITADGISNDATPPLQINKASLSKKAVLIKTSSRQYSITISGRRRVHKQLMLGIRQLQTTGKHNLVNTGPPTKTKG